MMVMINVMCSHNHVTFSFVFNSNIIINLLQMAEAFVLILHTLFVASSCLPNLLLSLFVMIIVLLCGGETLGSGSNNIICILHVWILLKCNDHVTGSVCKYALLIMDNAAPWY